MTDNKTIANYTKIYRKVLTKGQFQDIDTQTQAYRKRLSEMYASEQFRRYSIYPTVNAVHVFAVIAMCLELKQYSLSDMEIIDLINCGFSARRNFFKVLLRCIDLLPNAYRIAEKWNISDHAKRVKDGSLTYDYFNVSEGKSSTAYQSACMSKCSDCTGSGVCAGSSA